MRHVYEQKPKIILNGKWNWAPSSPGLVSPLEWPHVSFKPQPGFPVRLWACKQEEEEGGVQSLGTRKNLVTTNMKHSRQGAFWRLPVRNTV